jgi:C_GCAxxG_C_C family probable redox protein
MSMTREEKARELFKSGYNCAQAVVLAYEDELGLNREAAARLASSFGAGMGRMREVCGALSGAFMVAGWVRGYSDPTARDEKAIHYERVQRIAAAFRAETGAIRCAELLGAKGKDTSPTPDARTADYYKKRPCAEMVALAVRLLEEDLAKYP